MCSMSFSIDKNAHAGTSYRAAMAFYSERPEAVLSIEVRLHGLRPT